jgi:hypothetical protein
LRSSATHDAEALAGIPDLSDDVLGKIDAELAQLKK